MNTELSFFRDGEDTDPTHLIGLLRARDNRPDRCAARKGDEFAPSHVRLRPRGLDPAHRIASNCPLEGVPLEVGRCPLWVKSGHVQCNSVCPLCANSGHCVIHSTTSSARSSSDGGIVRPSALAAARNSLQNWADRPAARSLEDPSFNWWLFHARNRSAKQIGTATHFCHPMTQSVDRHDVR